MQNAEYQYQLNGSDLEISTDLSQELYQKSSQWSWRTAEDHRQWCEGIRWLVDICVYLLVVCRVVLVRWETSWSTTWSSSSLPGSASSYWVRNLSINHNSYSRPIIIRIRLPLAGSASSYWVRNLSINLNSYSLSTNHNSWTDNLSTNHNSYSLSTNHNSYSLSTNRTVSLILFQPIIFLIPS